MVLEEIVQTELFPPIHRRFGAGSHINGLTELMGMPNPTPQANENNGPLSSEVTDYLSQLRENLGVSSPPQDTLPNTYQPQISEDMIDTIKNMVPDLGVKSTFDQEPQFHNDPYQHLNTALGSTVPSPPSIPDMYKPSLSNQQIDAVSHMNKNLGIPSMGIPQNQNYGLDNNHMPNPNLPEPILPLHQADYSQNALHHRPDLPMPRQENPEPFFRPIEPIKPITKLDIANNTLGRYEPEPMIQTKIDMQRDYRDALKPDFNFKAIKPITKLDIDEIKLKTYETEFKLPPKLDLPDRYTDNYGPGKPWGESFGKSIDNVKDIPQGSLHRPIIFKPEEPEFPKIQSELIIPQSPYPEIQITQQGFKPKIDSTDFGKKNYDLLPENNPCRQENLIPQIQSIKQDLGIGDDLLQGGIKLKSPLDPPVGAYDYVKDRLEIMPQEPFRMPGEETKSYDDFMQRNVIPHEMGHVKAIDMHGKPDDLGLPLTGTRGIHEQVADMVARHVPGFAESQQDLLQDQYHQAPDIQDPIGIAEENHVEPMMDHFAYLKASAREHAVPEVEEKIDLAVYQGITMRTNNPGVAAGVVDDLNKMTDTIQHAGMNAATDTTDEFKEKAQTTYNDNLSLHNKLLDIFNKK